MKKKPGSDEAVPETRPGCDLKYSKLGEPPRLYHYPAPKENSSSLGRVEEQDFPSLAKRILKNILLGDSDRSRINPEIIPRAEVDPKILAERHLLRVQADTKNYVVESAECGDGKGNTIDLRAPIHRPPVEENRILNAQPATKPTRQVGKMESNVP